MKNYISKSLHVKFSILQIAYWTAVGTFGTFGLAYIRTKGISATYIGMMAAVFRLSAIFGQFIIGNVCDRLQSNKLVYIITNVLMVFVCLGFYFSSSPLGYMVTYALLGFFQSPTSSNLDTWILKKFNGNTGAYGPIRAMGSLGYAVFILFFGTLVAGSGYVVLPIFMVLLSAITVLVSFVTQDATESVAVMEKEKIKPKDILALFRIPSYVFLLATLFFSGLTVMNINQMKFLIWESMNASIAYQGYDGFVGAFSQFPMILLSARFTKSSPYKRMVLGILMELTMIIIIYFARIPQIVVFCNMLGGVAYGLILPAMRQIIFHTTPAKLQTTAQGIGDAFYISISGMVGATFLGRIVDLYGIKQMILLCAFLHVIPLVLSSIRYMQTRKQN